MSISAETSVGKLKDAVTLIDTCSGSCALNVAQITSSLKSLDESFLCVATLNNLPAACDNTGRFVYVQSIEAFRYSDGYEWLMNACSVCNATTSLFTWGRNICGSLGNGTVTSRSSPGTVAGGGATWCQISASYHSTAIKTDGTLWTWGSNFCGGLGDGTTVSRCSPGTIWGSYTTWCRVDGGNGHTLAIKTDGTLWTWGSNYCGRLGDGTTVNRCSPGTIAGGGTNWCQVFGASNHSTAIKTDGTIWTWGYNGVGTLGDGTTVSRCSPGTIWGSATTWCQVSSKFFHTLAIKCDGTLWTWGFNSSGRLGDGTTVSRSSPGTTWGSYTTWCKLSGVSFQSAAIKCDGTLWTWGRNCCGALGNGTTVDRCSPGTVAGSGTNWCQVDGAICHTLAIKTDGTLWTWGLNYCGRLGDGTTVNRCSPGTIAGGGTNWCQVSSRTDVLALKSRGF